MKFNCRAPSRRLRGRQPSTNIRIQPIKPGSLHAAGSRRDFRPSKSTTPQRPAVSPFAYSRIRVRTCCEYANDII